MRTTLEIRLEIIRRVREQKLRLLDLEINILEDQGLDSSALRERRHRLRNITEPYKALLEMEELPSESPLLVHEWDAFTSVDWD